MRLDGKGKCGCARHSFVGVDLWRTGQAGWVCDGGVQLSFCGAPRGVCKAPLMVVVR